MVWFESELRCEKRGEGKRFEEQVVNDDDDASGRVAFSVRRRRRGSKMNDRVWSEQAWAP